MNRTMAAIHYAEHAGKDFYPRLVDMITAGPLVACVLEGEHAQVSTVVAVRQMVGTFMTPGTIRGDFGLVNPYNLIHASDGPPAAEREIELFFPEGL
jgi:nucleoside-diphosphate kinase